ncbi:MAG: hypothetical protein OEQ39_06285 [Gammaproteobacteria bacterium]|nr:hypothetical protein [Gammaproteobacteria bacterium]MDH3469309.1 hypothetical protein [Gammaproteobacteria bacterium]
MKGSDFRGFRAKALDRGVAPSLHQGLRITKVEHAKRATVGSQNKIRVAYRGVRVLSRTPVVVCIISRNNWLGDLVDSGKLWTQMVNCSTHPFYGKYFDNPASI